MKSKIAILSLLVGSMLLVSCNSDKGWAYYRDEGKDMVSKFQAPDKSEYSADYEGFFLDLWNSKTYPTTISDKLSADMKDTSALLGVVTILNSENYENAYKMMDLTFVASDNPSLYLKVEQDKDGNVTFSVQNSNLRLYLYGFTNGKFDEWAGATATARWNVFITYDNHGQLLSEHAYTTASYTNDKRGNVDIKATYSLS